jgi:2-polyprenyl-6-methoxyphenol hydroxylase-like FAD-dependent oxidoreductase
VSPLCQGLRCVPLASLNLLFPHRFRLTVPKNKDEVFTKVEERATGRQYVIRSQHVIACDGGRSAVRKMLGIECEGEDSCMTHCVSFSVLFS